MALGLGCHRLSAAPFFFLSPRLMTTDENVVASVISAGYILWKHCHQRNGTTAMASRLRMHKLSRCCKWVESSRVQKCQLLGFCIVRDFCLLSLSRHRSSGRETRIHWARDTPSNDTVKKRRNQRKNNATDPRRIAIVANALPSKSSDTFMPQQIEKKNKKKCANEKYVRRNWLRQEKSEEKPTFFSLSFGVANACAAVAREHKSTGGDERKWKAEKKNRKKTSKKKMEN